MPKDADVYLKHILDECSYLNSATQEMDFSSFLEDETLKRAVVRSLEIIGEATKKIPADFKVLHSTVQWKNMAGMRDRLIHDYMASIIQLSGMLSKIKYRNLPFKLNKYCRKNKNLRFKQRFY
ncbi:MAG: HepT-like ribonuclease domain-containing protein [Moheibacter sp.]